MAKLTASLLLLLLLSSSEIAAQVDANTSLLLRFENSLTGEQGETPVQGSGHGFAAGVQGQAATIGQGTQLSYASANNIGSLEGTVEFWIKPTWNGNDSQALSIRNLL